MASNKAKAAAAAGLQQQQEDDDSGAESEDYESEDEASNKGGSSKGKGKGKDGGKVVKRRSSKACDNCRKSKCKCTRIIDPDTNQPIGPCDNCRTTGSECKFEGASRKRGPPKGYIEAIESRLHRMEALLGGLLQNDDPRAQALLGELIGDDQARAVLTKDLKVASESGPSSKPRKSWKKTDANSPSDPSPAPYSNSSMGPPPPVVSRGFSVSAPSPMLDLGDASGQGVFGSLGAPGTTPRYFSEEDLGFGNMMQAMQGGGGGVGNMGQYGASPGGLGSFGGSSGAVGFDPLGGMGSQQQQQQYRNSLGGMGGLRDSDEDSMSPSVFGGNGVDIPMQGTSVAGDGTMNPLFASTPHSLPLSLPPQSSLVQRHSSSSIPQSTQQQQSTVGSPRQRRKLNAAASASGSTPTPFSFQPNKLALPVNAINHTGQSTYTLSDQADLSPAGDGEGDGVSGSGQQLSELADVVGQLSLNENSEVRYHGRSSGLYLISKSARYKDFFWQFPSAGVWPPTDGRVLKTENEILIAAGCEDPLPDRATQQHLLDLYWCYVHPHFPILYKISFMRQYRHALSNPNSTEPSTPAGSGKVPVVLLLSMFALAARYSDLDPPRSDGKYWTAGQDYLEKAKKVLNYDYGSSKLVSVQALLLMAYREIGTGGMSASWLFTGMAIRMAQDLGLFRDVEKWYLPVQRFSHEEKQTRKRVWWGCIILDRYTASYIGRPGTIHERDYDTSFPSEDEPDEKEQWRPLRPDGTDWSGPPKDESETSVINLSRYPPMKANSISCFNAAGALAVIINRIIANIYAIRIRVLGQSSETLLSLLDQSLASWYLALPTHLSYNPASKKVPPPHVLALHLQFYSALILLHRPFIPGQSSDSSPTHFPSHSICTTSANAIANIVTTFTKTFTLRQCPPFLTYPIFSAAVICVYNAGFDEALARPAKIHLIECMNALKEMEVIWGSAIRQWELLHGLVDLRDASLSNELHMMDTSDESRGTKRPAEEGSGASTPAARANFHARPLGRPSLSAGNSTKPRRRSTSVASNNTQATPGVVPAQSPSLASPSLADLADLQAAASANQPIIFNPTGNNLQSLSQFGLDGAHQSYDILSHAGPIPDLSQFQATGTNSNMGQNFSDLLNSFLAPTEAASHAHRAEQAPTSSQNDQDAFNAAFFGVPLGTSDEWANYLPQAFFTTPEGMNPASPPDNKST